MAFDLADIGARVRAYRLGAGYNADELAARLGCRVPRSTASSRGDRQD